MWEISFQGCETFYLSDVNGLFYIHELLSNPNKEILVATLEMSNNDGAVGMHQESDFEDGLNTDGDSSDEVMDATTRKEIKDRLLELIEDRKEAEAKGDEKALIKIDEETEGIRKYLASSSRLGGKSREMPSVDEKARQRVYKAIKKAYEKIELEGKCPDLVKYLNVSISKGYMCEYKPPVQPDNVDWILM